MHWSVSPAGPVHPAALIHTQQLYAALLETMAFAENRIQEGIFFFFAKKPQLKFKWGEILLLVGFPLWDLQNFELKVTESNRDSRIFYFIYFFYHI